VGIRCEARLWRGSDRIEQRAAVLHEDWCRAAGRPGLWAQLTPDCQAVWLSVASGRPIGAPGEQRRGRAA
jgi:hypothetical protein